MLQLFIPEAVRRVSLDAQPLATLLLVNLEVPLTPVYIAVAFEG
jgi:hypothetical protein